VVIGSKAACTLFLMAVFHASLVGSESVSLSTKSTSQAMHCISQVYKSYNAPDPIPPQRDQEGSPLPGLGPSSISSKLINLSLIGGLSSPSSLCTCPSSLSPDLIGVKVLLCLGTDPKGLLVSNLNCSPGLCGTLDRRGRVSVENECVLETVMDRGGVESAGEYGIGLG
jgi:hypothetical protein